MSQLSFNFNTESQESTETMNNLSTIEIIKAIRKLYDIPTYKLLDLEKETLAILLKEMQNTKKQG